jgi:hypothetical protein
VSLPWHKNLSKCCRVFIAAVVASINPSRPLPRVPWHRHPPLCRSRVPSGTRPLRSSPQQLSVLEGSCVASSSRCDDARPP